MAHAQPKPNQFTFTISRSFNAPRDRVWAAWTTPELVRQWFGPKGCSIPECEVDLRSGGGSRYTMEFGGFTMRGQWKYLEVQAPEKIVALVSFLNEKGEIITHPGMANWPKEVHSTVVFTEAGGKTTITVDWTAWNASEIEERVFAEGAAGMEQGWGGSFDQLGAFLGG